MSSPFITTMSAQPGPQTDFLRSPADICIYGGAAGGGKTVGLTGAAAIRPSRRQLYRGLLPADDAADHQSRRVVGRNPELLSAARRHRASRGARVALATRRQDQVRAPSVRH